MGSNTVFFDFTYDSTEQSFGYKDENGNFVPFSSGGTDVSDTTATADKVLSGYYFYGADGARTQGTYVPLDTSDATAKSKHIEAGYTAYARGRKIVGTASVTHSDSLVKYSGSITLINNGKSEILGVSNQNYAFFIGGNNNSTSSYTDVVDYYDISLVKGVSSSLWRYVTGLSGTNVGEYALCNTGYESWSSSNMVYAFNNSAQRQSVHKLQGRVRYQVGATSIGNYAIFASGSNYSGSTQQTTSYVDCFDSSLTYSILNNLDNAYYSLNGASTQDYAIFYNFAYNSSLTRTTFSGGLSSKGSGIDSRVIYVYGSSYGDSTAYSINNSLTTSNLGNLPRSRASLGTASLRDDDIIAFAGGYYGSSSYSYYNTVDYFDSSATRKNASGLGENKASVAGASIGAYIIFAGGFTRMYEYFSKTVDAYYVS